MKYRVPGLMVFIITLGVITPELRAQNRNPENATIDGIRVLTTIGNLDQERIRRWIQFEVDQLTDLPKNNGSDGFHAAGFKTFLRRFLRQKNDTGNTNAFLTQLSTQTAAVATQTFQQAGGSITAIRSLARAIFELSTPETLAGSLVGIQTADNASRFLCAKIITNLRSTISQNQGTQNQVMQTLQNAGMAETDPIVLGQIYTALKIGNDNSSLLNAYEKIFDQRLKKRKAQMVKVDGAEMHAFDILRQPTVVNAMNANQKSSLAQRLAVFMRLDAQRYNDPMIAPPTEAGQPDFNFRERDVIERRLDAVEDILTAIAGSNKGGKVRNVLANEGFDGRGNILNEVHKWIGNAQANTRGVLNNAPWNVRVGAP